MNGIGLSRSINHLVNKPLLAGHGHSMNIFIYIGGVPAFEIFISLANLCSGLGKIY